MRPKPRPRLDAAARSRRRHEQHQREHRHDAVDAGVEHLAKARRDDAARRAAGSHLDEPVDDDRGAERQDEGRHAAEAISRPLASPISGADEAGRRRAPTPRFSGLPSIISAQTTALDRDDAPTDRSTPRRIITKVTPTAVMPTGVAWRREIGEVVELEERVRDAARRQASSSDEHDPDRVAVERARGSAAAAAVPPRPSCRPRRPAGPVGEDRADDDQALDEDLREGRHLQQVEQVVRARRAAAPRRGCRAMLTRPPLSGVPPSTTATMASSSMPSPAFG